MKISVVLATYNGARFLAQQIESLIGQTAPPHELIVSDDGSADDSLQIVAEAAERCPFPVHVHRNPSPLGYADNFLSAGERACGDYIAFCDQDDVWLPHKLATYAAWIDERPQAALYIHRGEVVDADLTPVGAYHPHVAETRYLPPLTASVFARPPGFAMCFPRRLISDFDWRSRPQDFEFQDSRTKHDAWIATLANATGGIFYSTEVLVRYRRHQSNSSYFRKGSQRARRLAQMRDAILKAPSEQMLQVTLKAFAEHAAYFERAAQGSPEPAASALRKAAALYRKGESGAARSLRLHQGRDTAPFAAVIGNLLDGYYTMSGRLERRVIVRDAVASMRSALPHSK